MARLVDCPYCGAENEMFDYQENGSTFDHECEECGKAFEVTVEYNPTFSADTITYRICERCGKKYRSYGWSSRKICPACYSKVMEKKIREMAREKAGNMKGVINK